MNRVFQILTLCLFGAVLHADVSAPSIFGDHMVLQQGTTLPVWGKASPGEQVTVTCGGQSVVTIADAAGKWRVTLRPFDPSESPGQIVINGDTNRLEFHDVIAGDVWLCAGGGNMAMSLSEAEGGEQAVPASGDRSMRCYFPGRADDPAPPDTASGHWEVCDSSSAREFPAVGFFFSRDLRASHHLPIGIINCSTAKDAPIASWMPAQGGGQLFRELIAPVVPYAITGAIWYQGEGDEGRDAPGYRRLLPKLVRDWRARWGAGPFPFYAVSLAGFGAREGACVEPFHGIEGMPSRGWPWIREGISCILPLPYTGVAMATDLGVPDERHPPDKLHVGRRLALLARNRVYGEDLPDEGPLYKSMKVEGSRVRLFFETLGGDLTIGVSPSSGEASMSDLTPMLKGFALAGADGNWYPAKALIEGESVVLSSDAVSRPVSVRYNWKGFPEGNLYNKSGLPAPPFRTDSYQP